jgi:hypothetical protein
MGVAAEDDTTIIKALNARIKVGYVDVSVLQSNNKLYVRSSLFLPKSNCTRTKSRRKEMAIASAKRMIFFIPVIAMLIGCQSAQDAEKAKMQKLTADSQKVIEQAKAALPKIEILDQADVTENGSTYVIGTARASEAVSYAQLSFGVLDSGGNRIGTALTNISNLKAGDTWKFKALILQKEAAQVTKPEIFAK